MHLVALTAENFRLFGPEAAGKHLRLEIKRGLTVLVGANDAGKSAVIDALRLVLGAKGQDFLRVSDDDFHREKGVPAENFRLHCRFEGLSDPERARFLEWLSLEEKEPVLEVTLMVFRAKRKNRNGVEAYVADSSWRSGPKGGGRAIEGDLRSYLLSTYLKPLRDAEMEMAAGRGSRLSQLLLNHPALKGQDQPSDIPEPETGKPMLPPATLVGIMKTAEGWIQSSDSLTQAKKQLNDDYLRNLSTGTTLLQGEITIGRNADLKAILEKLELWLNSSLTPGERLRHGLGLNNLLFMAAEFLLLSETAEAGLPLLLIEEPEAHLHPQLQLRLMEFLETKTAGNAPVQVIVTTHSPTLSAKANIENLTMLAAGRAFSLGPNHTKLSPGDYRFLRRFLDATKANLFFARGVVIVEGDAENILLPVLSELLGRSFTRHGVSVVNVGHRGLFRYARIFQRADGKQPPVRVACVSDRDIPTDESKGYVPAKKKGPKFTGDFDPPKLTVHLAALKKHDGGVVQTFVSPEWTLEHDIALGGFARELHTAIAIAKELKNFPGELTAEETAKTVAAAELEYDAFAASKNAREIAALVYQPLYEEEASKTETAQIFADRLTNGGHSEAALRANLPAHVLAAIDYVTADHPAP